MMPVFKNFEREWFSLRAFLRHIIIPWLIVSALAYMVASTGQDAHASFRRVILVLFFSLYFLVIRSGLLVMTRNLHDTLKKDYGEAYARELSAHQDFGLLGLKLGATLARIKRRLIDEQQRKRARQKQAFQPKP
ncbi:MAG TPA: hypothetical protein ENJ42_03445 [Hellea balneolensis]|uniref:Uncharacterized protein n=1 Tax=Hellea balneolensis TaxID=287478 RepID=A0A7C5LUQ2_9PROT|nr:hypothetical protein [Hellea balneolensis]